MTARLKLFPISLAFSIFLKIMLLQRSRVAQASFLGLFHVELCPWPPMDSPEASVRAFIGGWLGLGRAWGSLDGLRRLPSSESGTAKAAFGRMRIVWNVFLGAMA